MILQAIRIGIGLRNNRDQCISVVSIRRRLLLLLVLPSVSMSYLLLRVPRHTPPASTRVPWNHHHLRRRCLHGNTRQSDRVNPLFLVAEKFRQHLQQYPDVSVIIPAYNEQDRILPTLERYKYYLRRHEERWNVKCFIYVVDDGSTDQSKEVIQKVSHASTSTPAVFCISLEENRGKGTALATGMQTVLLHHNHDDNDVPMLILTADADGSAEIADLEVLYKTMMQLLSHQQSSFDLNTSIDWNQPAIICGYRTYNQHVNDDDDAKISGRLVFRWGFRMIVRSFCGDLGTRDSQCGFKLLTLPAAALLYSNLHLQKWSHDVEVLYRAKLWNVPVAEAPVRWQDKTGSKLTAEGVVKVAARMFYDVLICRLNYDLGNWK